MYGQTSRYPRKSISYTFLCEEKRRAYTVPHISIFGRARLIYSSCILTIRIPSRKTFVRVLSIHSFALRHDTEFDSRTNLNGLP
ncbi:hypothetical protein HBI34_106790 [Parastagonospora nodorum]|nr:hypothetical protein HBI34_106790 [Parastagonospora nodorum]